MLAKQNDYKNILRSPAEVRATQPRMAGIAETIAYVQGLKDATSLEFTKRIVTFPLTPPRVRML